MNIQKLKLLLATACLAPLPLIAQITERERPAEWKHLITGGRYMDRFEAMPDGTLSGDTWGADSVRPRYIDNGIEHPDISFWGGNILQTPDRKYHLFVCGWPESAPKGSHKIEFEVKSVGDDSVDIEEHSSFIGE